LAATNTAKQNQRQSKTNSKVKPTTKQAQSLALNLTGTSEFIREMESKLFSAK